MATAIRACAIVTVSLMQKQFRLHLISPIKKKIFRLKQTGNISVLFLTSLQTPRQQYRKPLLQLISHLCLNNFSSLYFILRRLK